MRVILCYRNHGKIIISSEGQLCDHHCLIVWQIGHKARCSWVPRNDGVLLGNCWNSISDEHIFTDL